MRKAGIILGVIMVVVFSQRMVKNLFESGFERLDSDYIDLLDYPTSYKVPHLKEMHPDIRKDGIDFTEVYTSWSNRFIPKYYNDKFWVVTTGVAAIDDGVQFFYLPTYSRILVIDRDSREVVVNKFFFRYVSNVTIKDGYIYFRYRFFHTYKLGRFKFDPQVVE